jgi:tyrosyl-tRNA synthetase
LKAGSHAVQAGENPRNIKVRFAQEIVARFHSQTDAESALNDFKRAQKAVFQMMCLKCESLLTRRALELPRY